MPGMEDSESLHKATFITSGLSSDGPAAKLLGLLGGLGFLVARMSS